MAGQYFVKFYIYTEIIAKNLVHLDCSIERYLVLLLA